MSESYLTMILSNLRMTEQKSDAWLEERKGMITGSEMFKALDDITQLEDINLIMENGTVVSNTLTHTLYDSDKQVNWLNGKLGIVKPTPFIVNSAIDWGSKFENISRMVHELRTGLVFKEYGLVPHKTVKYFGASPDGLSVSNPPISLEIKNAFGSRSFYSSRMKLDYWFQCQWVMYCINSWAQSNEDKIERTHFLETRFCKYNSMEEYLRDGGDTGYNQCGIEKGMIIEKKNGEWIYPLRIGCSIGEMGFNPDDIVNGKPIFWSLTEYSLIYIPIDERVASKFVPRLHEIWSRVGSSKRRTTVN